MNFLKNIVYTFASIALFAGAAFLSGCKKWAEVDTPYTRISSGSAYKDVSTANAVLIGLFTKIGSPYLGGEVSSISITTDLSADNIDLFDVNGSRALLPYYKNDLGSQYIDIGDATFWRHIYNLLYTINDAIEQLSQDSPLPEAFRERLLGEAYFLRGFCYFYLTNLYGKVPLVLTTDPEDNAQIARSEITEVYEQIHKDLELAATLLINEYASANGLSNTDQERLRPNLSTVYALQARVFLYEKKFSSAVAAATQVIEDGRYTIADAAQVFAKNSTETIWALQPTGIGQNTLTGRFFIIPETGPTSENYNLFASSSLVNSFEAGDVRRISWIDSVEKNNVTYHFPYKYKVGGEPGLSVITEYDIVFRVSEQYLIRAEANAEQGNIADAVRDLNDLRAHRRAAPNGTVNDPLPDLSESLTKEQLLVLISRERRSELFTEWGHRWFDLRRSGNINQVMTTAASHKGGSWNDDKALYPIPAKDILLNPKLSQNPGYTD